MQRVQAGTVAGRRLAETESNLVFVTIGDLQQGAQYEFVLENLGVKSTPIQGNTRISGAPDAPKDVHAIPGPSEVNVFWVKSSRATQQYVYVRQFISEFETVPVEGFPKRLPSHLIGHTIKNLQAGSTYTIQIQEANSNGKGPKSAVLLVNTKSSDPNAPIDLSSDASQKVATMPVNYNGLIIAVISFVAGLLFCGVILFFVVRHY